MATIVVQRSTGRRYVLVGTGYGMAETATPGVFWGNWAPDVKRSEMSLVAVCDADGSIGWYRLEEIQVVEIDGKPPQHWLSGEPFR